MEFHKLLMKGINLELVRAKEGARFAAINILFRGVTSYLRCVILDAPLIILKRHVSNFFSIKFNQLNNLG